MTIGRIWQDGARNVWLACSCSEFADRHCELNWGAQYVVYFTPDSFCWSANVACRVCGARYVPRLAQRTVLSFLFQEGLGVVIDQLCEWVLNEEL